MKKTTFLPMLLASVMTLAGCSTDDDLSSGLDTYNTWGQDGNSGSSATTGTTTAELTSFTIEIDKDTAEPEASGTEYYPDDEDRLENNTFETEVHITFSGSSASYTAADGVTIKTSGAHVVADHGATKGVSYVVSGSTTEGSLTIVGDKKYQVRLAGASITNPDSTALNLLSKKRAFILLDAGTENTLADGTSTKAEDQKAAFYSKGKLLVNGTGKLSVYGNYNNGIQSADYIVLRQGSNIYVNAKNGHGVKTNDGIFINGGILNIEVAGASAKGLNSESSIAINGGRTTVITTGAGEYDAEEQDVKGAAGVKTDADFSMGGGQLFLMSSGAGGKGIKADTDLNIDGGEIRIITTGKQLVYNRLTTSPKGIKAKGALGIYGGKVMVRTSGTNGEGIESKSTLTIADGTVEVASYDDAINSSGDMRISGGTVVVVATNNDGLDSNGNMYISGGNIVAFGASGAETGIDIDEQHKLYLTGGAVFGIGGRLDLGSVSAEQAFATSSGSVSAGSEVTVSNGTTTLASFTMPPYSYNNGTIIVSAPGMTSGTSYTLTLSSGSQTVSGTTSYSGGGFGGGGMGGFGGRPGGW